MIYKLIVLSCLLALTVAAPTEIGARVVQGQDAKLGEFPHQVSLQRGHSTVYGNLEHFCGGSIINDKWVLTAGHCVHAAYSYKVFVIKAGKYNINQYEKNEQVVEVEDSFIHELYPGNVAPYDIALLKLKTALEFNEYVEPIKLPASGTETVGVTTISGWGSVSKTGIPEYPSILQTAVLKVLDYKSCKTTLGKSLHKTNLCTTPGSMGGGACSGDSGGPLIAKNNGQNEIVGIVSWGKIPCGKGPSVFVKVSSFIDWIKDTMSKC